MNHDTEPPAESARRYAKVAMRWCAVTGAGASLTGGTLVAAQATRLFAPVREPLVVAAGVSLFVGGVAVAGIVLAGVVWAASGISADPLTRDRIRVVQAAQQMSRDELERAIEALGETEDRLLMEGRREQALRVAEDRTLCLYVLDRRQRAPGPS
ncbi:hypothetical protein AB4Z09_28380 [Rhodococcus sp. TAF43]|uniref:hypothetical protein n=1 Tax=Rhodococcus sp. TAF43 TaxID=3237483 RepID=UPI003F9A0B0E